MRYNVKMFEFPNGEIQIRYYDTPMKSAELNMYEDDVQLVYNPFYNREMEIREWKDEGRIITREEKELCKKKSMNRTKQMIYMYSRCVAWEYFVTLTFNQEKVNRYDYVECSKIVRKWLNNQKNRVAPNLKYLVVPEMHKDGAWHFHGLLADVGNMSFVDSGHSSGKKVIYNMDKWKYGFTTATKIEDIHKVAKYVGKYITKDMCECTGGRQRYFVSQNISSPDVSTFLIGNDENVDDFVSKLGASLGKELTFCKSCDSNGFVGVSYFELQ